MKAYGLKCQPLILKYFTIALHTAKNIRGDRSIRKYNVRFQWYLWMISTALKDIQTAVFPVICANFQKWCYVASEPLCANSGSGEGSAKRISSETEAVVASANPARNGSHKVSTAVDRRN